MRSLSIICIDQCQPLSYQISSTLPSQLLMNKTGTMLPKHANKFSPEKMETSYIDNLEELVKLLSDIVTLLCDENTIQSSSIAQLSQLYSELKYTQKMKNEESYSKELNKYVEQALLAIKQKNEEFPKIKQMKSQNHSELATIAEKYSQENILSNYLRKNSHHRSKKYNNLSELQHYSETLHLGSEVNRQETRRSLDSSRETDKKPLYRQLEKIKAKEPQINAYKVYQEPARKFNVKSKLPQYNISKLI